MSIEINNIVPRKFNYLSRLLTPRQKDFGFVLEEDDHCLILKLKDMVKARWIVSRFGPTPIAIQEQTDRIMEAEIGLFTFGNNEQLATVKSLVDLK